MSETGNELVYVTMHYEVWGHEPMREKRRFLPDVQFDPTGVDILVWPYRGWVQAIIDGPVIGRNGRAHRSRGVELFFEGDPATWPDWLAQLAEQAKMRAMNVVEAPETV